MKTQPKFQFKSPATFQVNKKVSKKVNKKVNKKLSKIFEDCVKPRETICNVVFLKINTIILY